jgi:tripartite-type tricarboxylate transporter receptor subunit TctC
MGIRDQLKEGKIKLIMQLALKKHPDLPDVPLVTELVSESEGKRVLELIFARQSMGRPIVAPPGMDPRITASLRKAFADVLRDPEFMAECDKLGLEISYVSGEEVQNLVKGFYNLPDSVIVQARKIMAAQ